MKKFAKIIRNVLRINKNFRLATSAAALSYHVTMTFFPLVICLYTLLGNNQESFEPVVDFLSRFFAADTVALLEDFLTYVAENNSPAMMVAGLVVLVTSASSSFRTLQSSIGMMQGGRRYKGIAYYFFSGIYSLLFLATMYFAILVMFTGKNFLEFVNKYLPVVNITGSWNELRYILLSAIFLVTIWGMFGASKREDDNYSTFFGSLFSTVALIVACRIFSFFIAKSANYSIVYGSLASIVLLMVWLYYCCLVICYGAALNIAIRDLNAELETEMIKRAKEEREQRRKDNDHIIFPRE